MSIHPVHTDLFARFDLYDARQNLEAAYDLWLRAGWSPWGAQ